VSDCCASAGAAANSISAIIAMRAMRDNGETVVIVARQHTSARHGGEARPIVIADLDRRSSLPGLTRQSIRFAKSSYEDGWTRGSSPRVTGKGRSPSPSVIAGLDPAVHPLTKIPLSLAKMMDPRPKPAGDDGAE